MAPAGFVRIGTIVKPHALKGEVAVIPAADLPFVHLEGIEVWFVPPRAGAPRSARVVGVRQGPKGPLVTLEGVESISAADLLRGADMLAREGDVPEVEEDVDDVIGVKVVDEKRGDLGEVTELIVTGANDVWVVDGPFGEVLIPVIDDVILGYDEDADVVRVRLLPGLIDEDAT
jgi:16S rRNA processing protein RimM